MTEIHKHVPDLYYDSDSNYPCCYLNISSSASRKECVWTIGTRSYLEGEESKKYCFKMSEYFNVDDDKVWKFLTGLDCTIGLISAFRKGGEDAVKQCVKNIVV